MYDYDDINYDCICKENFDPTSIYYCPELLDIIRKPWNLFELLASRKLVSMNMSISRQFFQRVEE
jgi:hypothetical protein